MSASDGPDEYPVPAGTVRVEDDVKHSRFITTLAPAPTVESAHSFVGSVRLEFSDATHNCWAFVVGPPGSIARNGASDDGEPGGTAGRPMLGALLHSGLGDVAAVVTRYFGGVKLGRGGLVRAYSAGVQHALRDVSRTIHVERVLVCVDLPYAFVDPVRRIAAAHAARITGEQFSETARLTVAVPRSSLARFECDVNNSSSGRARIARVTDPESDD